MTKEEKVVEEEPLPKSPSENRSRKQEAVFGWGEDGVVGGHRMET